MEKVLVFGHKNPDTDSICSSIVYADLKKELGLNTEAVRLGDINGETEYALNYFNIEAPRFVEKVTGEAKNVILVDHNERQQSADDIDEAHILEVIDHHRIANFETADPLYYRAEPVGCTATIINKLYKEHGIKIRKEMAGLLLSAIISDSLLFKSPTCTAEDKKAAEELAAIAEVDLESYGMAMLKAGANTANKTAEQLINLDAKQFGIGNYQVVVAQVNTVDPNELLSRQEELKQVIEKTIEAKNLDLFLFVITDILNSNSIGLSYGPEATIVEKAYEVPLTDSRALLEGVVSRKKQIIPVLTKAFEDMA